MIIDRIKSKASSQYIQLLFNLNIPFWKLKGDNNNLILMFHGISLSKNNPFNSRHTYIKDFEQQLIYLKKHTNIVSIKDYFQENFHPTKINVAITFDDGYLNNLIYALQKIEKYNVPASFYSTCLFKEEDPYIWADFLQIAAYYGKEKISLENEEYQRRNFQYYRISDNKPLLAIVKNEKVEYSFKQEIYRELKDIFDKHKDNHQMHWKLMNMENLKAFSKSEFVTIGSHGFFHNNLGELDINDAVIEVNNSKHTLENIIQKEINEIGYPDGSFNNQLILEAKKSGLIYQLGTEYNEIDNFKNHTNIKGRKGIYQCSSWGNQLL
jgi:peptidoglycan/xylan/chitin deacetylase (PgdA/CDA1 family)